MLEFMDFIQMRQTGTFAKFEPEEVRSVLRQRIMEIDRYKELQIHRMESMAGSVKLTNFDAVAFVKKIEEEEFEYEDVLSSESCEPLGLLLLAMAFAFLSAHRAKQDLEILSEHLRGPVDLTASQVVALHKPFDSRGQEWESRIRHAARQVANGEKSGNRRGRRRSGRDRDERILTVEQVIAGDFEALFE